MGNDDRGIFTGQKMSERIIKIECPLCLKETKIAPGEVIESNICDECQDAAYDFEDHDWMNTGQSRAYWLCEFAGRAMQGLLSSEEDEGMTCVAQSKYSIRNAVSLLDALETKLKGERNGQ